MKLNKICFFPCLCLLLLGMISIAKASGPNNSNLLLDADFSTNFTVTPTATAETDNSRATHIGMLPPANKPTVWQQTAYYGMRATLPVYDVLTNRAIWTGAGGLLGAMLGGGYGWTSLAVGIAGAVVGYNVAGVLENQISASWMNTFTQAARKAGRDKKATGHIVGKTFNHYLISKAAKETADEVLNNCWKNA